MPTIPYGIDRATGKEVHIDEASKKNKYVCVICKQPLYVAEGEIKRKYFAHYRPLEDCPLRTVYHYESNRNNGNQTNNDIVQDFSDWMAYVKAVLEGDMEKASTLWDFDFPAENDKANPNEPVIPDEIVKKSASHDPNQNDSVRIVFRPTRPEALTNKEPILINLEPIETIFNQSTRNRNKAEFTKPLDFHVYMENDIEWFAKRAMLKPIIDGKVKNCPISGITIPVEHCDKCKYFLDFRQPISDPERPNVVVCQGHHILKGKAQQTLFD